MSHSLHQPALLSRRCLLNWGVHGLGATALSSMLQAGDTGTAVPHFAPRAQRVIKICLVGVLSQFDSFDYKRELEKFHG